MLLRNESGRMDPLVIPLVIAVFLVLGLAGFSVYTAVELSDARDVSENEIAAAVSAAETAQAEQLEADFAEREKSPVKSYMTSGANGSLTFSYPKTWSGLVDDGGSESTPLDATFHPDVIPEDAPTLALRVTIEDDPYDKEIESYTDDVEKGRVTATPIVVAEQTGVRYDGEIRNDINGAIVILPLRDKTIKVWTESTDFLADFNATVVPSLTYVP